MSIFNMKKPRLPSHYYIRFEPPDSSGDEVLFFTSERRNIKLKGRSFREFLQVVVPILDGQHTLEEIEAEVSAQFSPKDLEQGLQSRRTQPSAGFRSGYPPCRPTDAA